MSELVPFLICDECDQKFNEDRGLPHLKLLLGAECPGTLQPAFMLADLEKEIKERIKRESIVEFETDRRDNQMKQASLQSLLNTLRKARK